MPRSRRTPLLPTVCLVGIVKDEATNPAGGIVAYLERILPCVHSAMIVDTGSSDATLSLLTALQQRHPHLHVRTAPFQSFAHARNLSLQYAMELHATDEAARPGRAAAAIADRDSRAASALSEAAAAGILAMPLPVELPPFKHIMILDADEALSPSTLTFLAQVLALDGGQYTAASMAAPPPFQVSHSASFPAAPSALPSPLPYPFCLKFSCHCFDSTGRASHRSNSGLFNPRLFSADARFAFVNTVDDFRFERLMFDGRAIEGACYLREGQLGPALMQEYAHLRQHETDPDLIASPTLGHACDLEELWRAQMKLEHAAAVASGSIPDCANLSGSHPAAAGATAATAAERDLDAVAAAGSFSNLQLEEHAQCGTNGGGGGSRAAGAAGIGDGDDAASPSISDSSRALPMLLPMRHYIPSVAGRRRKNQWYRDRGAAAKATGSASGQPGAHTAPAGPTSAGGAAAHTPSAAASASAPAPADSGQPRVRAKSRIFAPSPSVL